MRFFWTGSIHTRKTVPGAFSKFGKPMSKGGLGIISIEAWNRVAYGYHFNSSLCSHYSLWVKWTSMHNIG